MLLEQQLARAMLLMVLKAMAMLRVNLVRAEGRGVPGHRARARPAAMTMSTLDLAGDAAHTAWLRGGAFEGAVQQVGFELLYSTHVGMAWQMQMSKSRSRVFPGSERSTQYHAPHIKAPHGTSSPGRTSKSRTMIASSTLAPADEDTRAGDGAKSRLGKPPQVGHDDRAWRRPGQEGRAPSTGCT